jgi:hypothetical protein
MFFPSAALCLIIQTFQFKTDNMAAAQAQLNNYLASIGFTEATLREQFNAQGLTSIDEVKELTDDDIKEICKIIRKPGGTIPNPAFGPGMAAGIPEVLANPGIPISFMQEKRLKLFAYYLRHLDRIQCPFQATHATIAHLNQMAILKEREEEEEDEDIKVPTKLEAVTKVHKMIEDLEDYFGK